MALHFMTDPRQSDEQEIEWIHPPDMFHLKRYDHMRDAREPNGMSSDFRYDAPIDHIMNILELMPASFDGYWDIHPADFRHKVDKCWFLPGYGRMFIRDNNRVLHKGHIVLNRCQHTNGEIFWFVAHGRRFKNNRGKEYFIPPFKFPLARVQGERLEVMRDLNTLIIDSITRV